VIASTEHSIWADVTWRYHGGAPDERNMYQLVQTDDGWKIAVLTPLTLAEVTSEYPRLLHTVIDTTAPRRSAEFYRQLLGYIYRPRVRPGSGAGHGAPARRVRTDTRGGRKLGLQPVERLQAATRPQPGGRQPPGRRRPVTGAGEVAREARPTEGLGAELIV